jgi:triosephosphate isomerase
LYGPGGAVKIDARFRQVVVVPSALVAGNWKMHGSRTMVRELLGALRRHAVPRGVEVVVCPPYPYLALAAEMLHGSGIVLGAQDLHPEPQGAYTGEVSGAMLREFGCRYVIVGHSERRQHAGESSELVALKAAAALREGVTPIVCVGESEQQRERNETFTVVGAQLDAVIARLGATDAAGIVVAYEPVWAIGTGRTATPEQAQEVHACLRAKLAANAPDLAAVRMLYGGSVKAANARELFAMPDIDGGLIGGASLKAEEFAAICDGAEGI